MAVRAPRIIAATIPPMRYFLPPSVSPLATFIAPKTITPNTAIYAIQ